MIGYFKTHIHFPSSDKELSRELIIQISSELNIQQTIFKLDLLKKFGEADCRALTPLLSPHINPYGLFPIDFNSIISVNTELSNEVRLTQ